jgi:hypothetical protein
MSEMRRTLTPNRQFRIHTPVSSINESLEVVEELRSMTPPSDRRREDAVLWFRGQHTHCGDARELAERKLVEVRDKLGALQRIETVLGRLVLDCRGRRGTVSCPLISALRQRERNDAAGATRQSTRSTSQR